MIGYLNKKKLRSGQVVVLAAVFLGLLLVAIGLAVDMGFAFAARARLQNCCDAAALAGAKSIPTAQEITNYAIDGYSRNLNRDAALQSNNGTTAVYNIGNDQVTVITPYQDADTSDFPAERCLKVSSVRIISTHFMKLLGINTMTIKAQAAAVGLPGGPVSTAKGCLPFGIVWDDFTFGQKIILKEGGGSGAHGYYGALALGGNGASTFENNIMYGYPGLISIDQDAEEWVPLEPGNMSGPTLKGITYRVNLCKHQPPCTASNYVSGCARTGVVPVIEALDLSGRSTVQIRGFAFIFLEGCYGSGNDCWVEGTLIRAVADDAKGSTTAPNYGLITSGSTQLLK
ncbi:MAG: pilus assembly protein TadG-related protein [bacterium]|jgi:Flp pilus assembly protein TadG|nr:pilus assembly protein TadG-related protein [bacterium]